MYNNNNTHNYKHMSDELTKYQNLYHETYENLIRLKEEYQQKVSDEQMKYNQLVSEMNVLKQELNKPVTPQLQQFLVS